MFTLYSNTYLTLSYLKKGGKDNGGGGGGNSGFARTPGFITLPYPSSLFFIVSEYAHGHQDQNQSLIRISNTGKLKFLSLIMREKRKNENIFNFWIECLACIDSVYHGKYCSALRFIILQKVLKNKQNVKSSEVGKGTVTVRSSLYLYIKKTIKKTCKNWTYTILTSKF